MEGTDVLLAAQYKKGKTTLILNLVRSLLDNQPFLGFPVAPSSGPVFFLNAEMPDLQFRQWVRDLAVRNDDQFFFWNVQGLGFNLQLPHHAQALVQAIRASGAKTLILDTFFALFHGEENSNSEVGAWTRALDAIKIQASIANTLLVHHMGRTPGEEGAEHARGASALDGWTGDRWILTAEGDQRFFSVPRGRGGSTVDNLDLEYDEITRALTRGSGVSRKEARASQSAENQEKLVQAVILAVRATPGMSTQKLRGAVGGNSYNVSRAAQKALQMGKIEDRGGGAGGHGGLLGASFHPVDSPPARVGARDGETGGISGSNTPVRSAEGAPGRRSLPRVRDGERSGPGRGRGGQSGPRLGSGTRGNRDG